LKDIGQHKGLRGKLYEIIYEADTKAGKIFDIILLWAIIISVSVVFVESVQNINNQYGHIIKIIEWFFTGLFTIEYLLRIITIRKPFKYIFSFYGIVDLLAVIPSYMTIIFVESHFFLVIRILRLLRVFRVLKFARYLGEAKVLKNALMASKPKIVVFLIAVLSIVVIIGSIMYIIEDEQAGFTSIPKSVYWAIVTLTTVGYGDISPQTSLGQALASLVMIIGYGILAVPTGIVTAEIALESKKVSNEISQLNHNKSIKNKNNYLDGRIVSTQVCPHCSAEGHDPDAIYCKYCGGYIN